MKIIISKEFAQDYTTRKAGEKLRRMMIENKDKKIELDFSGIKIASASFFDEAFGKLSQEAEELVVLKKIIIMNINELDYILLEQVCQTRKVEAPIRS